MTEQTWNINKIEFSKFLAVTQKNLWHNFVEKKKRIYVKVNKGNFEPNQAGIDLVLAILIYQIKENISDLHIEALNNIWWDIKYRKNKMLEILTYQEIKETLFEVIDYLYKDEREELRQNKKDYYDTFLWIVNEFSFKYDEEEIKKTIDKSKLSEAEKEVFDNMSEKKLKLLFINKINEALGTLYGFASQAKNMDSNVVVWYGAEGDEMIPEYSFRIAGKQQDIEIEWSKFFSVVQRLMLTEFFPLSKLWIWDYEPFVRSRLLSKKLNIIAWETNSGKTTTILSLLSETYNSLSWKIKFYSYEDPIEKPVWFMLQTQNQKNELNENWAYSADDAERFFLRWDPDGVLIWEIRDKNTATIATKLASSGHYCYATIHCDNVLSVIPRFWGWWLDVKNNITALWFVEVTQLVPTYKLEQYKEDWTIDEKIESWIVKINDLKEIPYEKYQRFVEYKKWAITREESKLTEKEIELFWFMVGRSFLVDIFQFYHTNDIGKIFTLQGNYIKYLQYLSTYFSNRFVDWDDFLSKKQFFIPFTKALNSTLKDRNFQKLISSPKMSWDDLAKSWKIVLEQARSILSAEELELINEGKKIIEDFFKDKYETDNWVKVPFTFGWFLENIYENGFLPFGIKPKGVVPMVEFFDYNEDYKCILEKDYDHLMYRTKTFTPMFLYAYLINQKTVKWGKCIDFFNVISMFSVDYELN